MRSVLSAALICMCAATPVKAQDLSSQELVRRAVERRAVEAAIWGMPIVSVDAMRQAFLRDAGGRYNDIAYFSRQADWKFQITTPNASTWYVYIPINLREGPLVLDIPAATGAGLFGSLNDAWQAPHADVGPTGEDQGKGGKYLLVPPDYMGAVPAGYIAVRFPTYNGYSFLRAIPETTSPADVAKALELVKKTRVYPFARAAKPPAQRHIDIAGMPFDGIARFDDTFYESLARIVSEEPILERDAVAMANLAAIGIDREKSFKPDAATREILRKAVIEARAGFIEYVMRLPRFAEGSCWQLPGSPIGPETGFSFEREGRLEVDERGALFFLGCAPPKKHGAATFYLLGTRDASGGALVGGKTYRLRVPPDVPARQFWAATVYDLETAGFLREAPRVELNSYDQKLRKNADGSVNVFFGPSAPVGSEANWVYTAPGKRWFALFRFYGPEQALFEKAWRLPDIEEMK